jgi:ATP-dependent RNA helicase HelY
MQCHLGDFASYAELRREISDIERELSAGQVRHERGKDIRSSQGRASKEKQLAELRRRMKQHPCHSCGEREAHARWGERWQKLRRETDALMAQIEGRTNLVAKTFDKICLLLSELEYLETVDGELRATEAGLKLARIYGERDLLVAECLRHNAWQNLDAPGLAAIAASLVYEARRDDEENTPRIPKGGFEASMNTTLEIWEEIEFLAKKQKLTKTNPPDIALSLPIHRWASGARLDSVLESFDMLPGDFIRWTKQIIDLLEQIAQTAEGKVEATAREAIDRVKRGIVAYSYFG